MRFSERMKFRRPRIELQTDNIDRGTRNILWNVIAQTIWKQNNSGLIGDSRLKNFFTDLWHNFFKWTLDSLDGYVHNNIHEVKEYFFGCEWHEVYDFLEFIAGTNTLHTAKFVELCNSNLEKEKSAYRIIGKNVVPITEEKEKETLEETLDLAGKNKLFGVKTHIENALSKISDRKKPDYRNCVKESISAVESLCKIIANDEKADLSKALKAIEREKKIKIHPALQGGFIKIYGYTSAADGIRHALLGKGSLDYEDDMYMLVSCSAFINYLIIKSQKSGIKFN